MGDMGELFNAMKVASQEKRASNRKTSAAMLDDAGVLYTPKNNGAHLILNAGYDFWPGTGKWIQRGTNKKGRGVRNLIKAIRATQKCKEYIRGPLGSVVGECDLKKEHEGVHRTNGVSEQDMLDELNQLKPLL